MRRFLLLAVILGIGLPLTQSSAVGAATSGIDTKVVQAGPKDGGGEPSVAIARDNTIYISYPGAHMDLVRSTDGGNTWTSGTSPESPSALRAAFRRVVSAASDTIRPFQMALMRSSLLTTRSLLRIR